MKRIRVRLQGKPVSVEIPCKNITPSLFGCMSHKSKSHKRKNLWNHLCDLRGFWSEWWGSNPRASRSQTARSINWTTPGNTKISYQKKQKKQFYCGQNCGKSDAIRHFWFLGKPQKPRGARVSGFPQKLLEHYTTTSQSKRATNCATPGYTIKPHHIISFWGDFVKGFQLWSNKWSNHSGYGIGR